jgi:ribosomal protein S18 acetylase RimI-like enzyme
MNLTVEQANLSVPEHARAIVEIIDSYARGSGGQNAPLTPLARDRLIPGLIDHPSAMVLLARADGRAVGAAVCVFSFSTFVGKPTVNIHDFAVLPDCQGNGIGSAMLAEVERCARERECCRITLEVHDTNEGAKRLYARTGFGPWDFPTLFVTKSL